VKLILRKPADHTWEDFQLKDEHGALVVSRNTTEIEEELLQTRNIGLLKFHFYEGTTAGKIKIFHLVIRDGFILIHLVVNSENSKLALIYKHILMINVSSQCNYFPI